MFTTLSMLAPWRLRVNTKTDRGSTPMMTSNERRILTLLAIASIPFAYVNTLFTQTVSFVADDFGRSDTDIGFGAAVVRWGVIIVPPIALLADRIGRRRVLVLSSWAAPLAAAVGALAPNYEWLVASQTIARPLALVINVMIIVMLTEEMSSESRARSLGYVAIASSLGAGAAVGALPLADLAESGWRFLYVGSLVWLPVAFVLQRKVPETARFARVHAKPNAAAVARISGSRFTTQVACAFLTSVFIGSASVYLVNYLRDVRNYDAFGVSLFTIGTAVPASVGLIVGGRLADHSGRRLVGASSLALGVLLVALSYATSGAAMWLAEIGGGLCLGIAYPALGVYRGEMFPTAHRGGGAATVTASNLIGGSVGLIVAGRLLDAGWSYGRVMGSLALAPLVVAVVVLMSFPETAHRELEEISPDDAGA
jgi:DHA1 family inner membrane transport protein